MIVEILSLAIAVLVAIVLYRMAKALFPLVINAIIALVALWLLGALGLGVAINVWSVLIVMVGGIAGLALVVLLHLLGIAF